VLTLTASAREIVSDIITSDGAPEDAGLRIEADPTRSGSSPTYVVTAADGPGPADRVVLHERAAVYLDPRVAAALDDKLLDVTVDDDGAVGFTVRDLGVPASLP